MEVACDVGDASNWQPVGTLEVTAWKEEALNTSANNTSPLGAAPPRAPIARGSSCPRMAASWARPLPPPLWTAAGPQILVAPPDARPCSPELSPAAPLVPPLARRSALYSTPAEAALPQRRRQQALSPPPRDPPLGSLREWSGSTTRGCGGEAAAAEAALPTLREWSGVTTRGGGGGGGGGGAAACVTWHIAPGSGTLSDTMAFMRAARGRACAAA